MDGEISEDERRAYEELRGVVARLRAPDGCPWDREQTHSSLRPYLLQEAYEVLAVLDEGPPERLAEEMGDLLFQILLHTQLAEEAGEFSMAQVLYGLAQKLIRRHPHVFGDVTLDNASQVVEQWDKLKQKERAEGESALAGVPRAMAALAYAQELLRRAERAGFAWPDRRDVIDKVVEELEELSRAESKQRAEEEFGDLLLNLANYARYLDIDAEQALRQAGHKFRHRFEAVEAEARREQKQMTSMSRDELMELWQKAKSETAHE